MSGSNPAGADSNQPLVTLVVTCFNHADYVEVALESVRAQTYQAIDLLVTDDASSDDTQLVVREWCARHAVEARFLFHDVNTGFAAILNEVVPMARGTYFATLSADDEMVPDRIERQVRRFEMSPPTCALVYSDVELVDERGVSMGSSSPGRSHPPGPDPFGALLGGGYIPAPTVMMRREAVRALTHFEVLKGGPYDEGLPFEDYDLWLRTARLYPIAYEPGDLVRYRQVPNSVSNSAPRAVPLENKVMVLQKHLGIRRDYDRAIAEYLSRRTARQLYEVGGDPTLTRTALRRALRVRRTPRVIAYALAAHLRVPYAWFHSVRRILSRAS